MHVRRQSYNIFFFKVSSADRAGRVVELDYTEAEMKTGFISFRCSVKVV